MSKLNNKGFTLIEVLASFLLVTIVFLIVFNVVRGTMASTVSEIDKISDAQIFEVAKSYVIEANVSFNDNGYTCITVQDLIDYGYINGASDGNKIIKVNRNNKTKVIEDVMYVDTCN